MTIQHLSTEAEPYQILNEEGALVNPPPDLTIERLLSLYRTMYTGRTFSQKIVALQRQGKATTFGVLTGQEATSVGIGAAMQPLDWLAATYRDIPALIVRGVPLSTLIYAYRGYTIPHPREIRCLPIQIVISTQILHAVGLAMAARISGDPVVAVGICGDGATSEGDFNEALNFAGVFHVPAVIIIENNGWAISVPRYKQCAAPTLAARGAGFGIPSLQVDGNDLLAVYDVVHKAIERARNGEGPTLIEALTYRIGAHTTADDPTRYRRAEEVEQWQKRDPIERVRRFLYQQSQMTYNPEDDQQLRQEVEIDVNQAAQEAQQQPSPAPDLFFEQTMAHLPPRLEAQREDARHFMSEKQKTNGVSE